MGNKVQYLAVLCHVAYSYFCWGIGVNSQLNPGQLVYYITLYQAVVLGINFTSRPGLCCENSLALPLKSWQQAHMMYEQLKKKKQLNPRQPLGLSLAASNTEGDSLVLNFFCEIAKVSTGATGGKWWREETPLLTSAVCSSATFEFQSFRRVLLLDLQNQCLKVRSHGPLSPSAQAVACNQTNVMYRYTLIRSSLTVMSGWFTDF